MNMLHAESLEDSGDIGLLTGTDSKTIFIVVDPNAEELACHAEVRDCVLFREYRFDFDRCIGSSHRI